VPVRCHGKVRDGFERSGVALALPRVEHGYAYYRGLPATGVLTGMTGTRYGLQQGQPVRLVRVFMGCLIECPPTLLLLPLLTFPCSQSKECYIVGTTDDRTFCLLWIRVIWLPYLATYEPMCMWRARVLLT